MLKIRVQKIPLNLSPTISICIPTYSGADYLGAAIESVLNQGFTDYELIIIDDNSPDQTAEIISRYQDHRIRYIKNLANLGPEGNWNKCLAEAKGKYFKLLPHDDTLASDCLSRQVEILDNDTNQSIALVFCARHIIDHNGRIIITRGYPSGKEGVISYYDAIKKSIRLGTNLIGEPGAVMFRKSLAEKVGFFDGSISYIIDLDYWFRLLLNGNAYYIAQPLASFRVASGSWSIDIGTRQSDDFKDFINRCTQNAAYQLTRSDIFMGKMMAKINNYLRLLFYNFHVSR
jgi:glycosyltransferase involved in cell wall biosynthesis